MWEDVGDWLKENGGNGLALVGSLLTGNVPAALAAGSALVSSATGTTDPVQALQSLKDDSSVRLRLAELAQQNESEIRKHLEAMARIDFEKKQADLIDSQLMHEQTQETIRNGDNSQDKDIRIVRPNMAKQSWYSTVLYTSFVVIGNAFKWHELAFVVEIAMLLSAPAWAYIGLRTVDKFPFKR